MNDMVFYRQTIYFWITNAIYLSLLIVILLLTWFKKMWLMYLAYREKSVTDDHHILLNLLYRASKNIESNVLIRTFIYIMIISICFITAVLQLVNCTPNELSATRTIGNLELYV